MSESKKKEDEKSEAEIKTEGTGAETSKEESTDAKEPEGGCCGGCS